MPAKETAETKPRASGKGKPKTKATGRYRVLSGIKYMGPDGKPRTALPYKLAPVDPKEPDGKQKRVDNYVDHLTEEQVADFHAKGCIEAEFE